jgi:hypothetical protein
LENPNEMLYFRKILIAFALTFAFMAVVGAILGPERKARWFKKRKMTNFTILNRRSILGEFMHFGYPCTWQGFLVTLGIFAVVGWFAYWYIFT